MKKNVFMLGGFILLTSSALAKEALVLPEQKPEILVVEKPVEVIVYRDRVLETPAKWRPNGSIDIQYRVYGKTENKVASPRTVPPIPIEPPRIPLVPLEPPHIPLVPLEPPHIPLVPLLPPPTLEEDDGETHWQAASLLEGEGEVYDDEDVDDLSETVEIPPMQAAEALEEKEDEKTSKWARKKRYNTGRLQVEAKLNFTEKQSLEIRERVYHALRTTKVDENERYGKAAADEDELRLRHFYRFGNLGNSKVNASSRLEYNTLHNSEKMSGSAYLAFDISSYLFQNNFIKTDYFRVGPTYTYAMKNKTNYSNQIGLLLESYFSLPYNFGLELNVHPKYMAYNKEFEIGEGKTKKHEFYAEVEAKLFHSLNLYKNNKWRLNLNTEGGYDPYQFHQYKVVKNREKKVEKRAYSLYALPTFQVSYQATEYVNVYAAAGAEYRNWVDTAESTASHWRWQPTAWAGMKVTF